MNIDLDQIEKNIRRGIVPTRDEVEMLIALARSGLARQEPVPAGWIDGESIKAMEAWTLIAEERLRQINKEGWTPEHDDQHIDGSLLSAAVIYLWHGTEKAAPYPSHVYHADSDPDQSATPLGWPWDAKWWKPKDRRRNVIRAGALCLADRDRRLRAGLPTGPADHKLGLALRELAALVPSPIGGVSEENEWKSQAALLSRKLAVAVETLQRIAEFPSHGRDDQGRAYEPNGAIGLIHNLAKAALPLAALISEPAK